MIDGIISQDLEKIENALRAHVFPGKKILVTGGAGFIGSWLCDSLLGLDADVVALDDLSTGRMKNITHLTGNSRFEFIKLDVRKFETSEKFDFIFHMASHASPNEYQVHPIETLQTSALGTFAMAELARKSNSTLLFASTSEVYGDPEVIPIPESYWGKVNPIGPRSCYDEGKRFAEAVLMAYVNKYGLDTRIPRIFNTYGPRLREDGLYGRVMSRFISQALKNKPMTVYGDGKQTRSFCYVTDAVAGLILLAASSKAKGEVVNIGNTQEVSILELANRIKEITKSKSDIAFFPLPKDDPKRRSPDITKINRLVGWKPSIGFEEGLKKTVAWFSRE